MNLYYVQYAIRNIRPEYLESYFSILEKDLRHLAKVNVKHSFVSDGKVYINVYVKENDPGMAAKAHLNAITSTAVDALNYNVEEDIKIDVIKTELVRS